jgi:replicative DNA helicase
MRDSMKAGAILSGALTRPLAMTDIVERLRGGAFYLTEPVYGNVDGKAVDRLMAEAADEIERLREVTALREKQLDTHIHALFAKEAEIERLRGFARWIVEAYDTDEWPAQKDIVAGAREALGDDAVRQSNNPPT